MVSAGIAEKLGKEALIMEIASKDFKSDILASYLVRKYNNYG